MSTKQVKSKGEPVPGALNMILAVGAMSLAMTMLRLASHTASTMWFIVAIVAFSFVNNTLFSLLHEAVHGIFHENRAVNEWFGRVLAAFFPTGFTLQRLAHLGHHRRNRTDRELFDYYRPGENVLVKFLQWYGILTGLYWLTLPLSCLLFLIVPDRWIKGFIKRSEESSLAHQTSVEGMLSGYKNASFAKIRLEILFSLAVQVALVYFLDLSWLGWLGCYAAFGFNWSSLQYTDHAFSKRDVYDGAWNLRVNRIVQYIFLNYHHHKAHHQHPTVSWLFLHHYVNSNEERPSFMSIYLKMWAGPRPLPEAENSENVSITTAHPS
jgi:fatty acid desaturase